MDTSWEVFIGQGNTIGCITSKRLDAVSRWGCQKNMQIAMMRMFGARLMVKDLASAKRKGYYMAGIFRGECDKLYCLEKFKCCRMIGN